MHLFDRLKKTKPLPQDPILPFHSLSPVGDAEIEQYENALLWALRNRKVKDIRNVALTGPYGSGKSSILKTFQERYKNDFEFLNISLATFKEEIPDESEEYRSKSDDVEGGEVNQTPEQEKGKKKVSDTDILRLIELSILQQIFYHEEDKTIPDSRFKKIRSFKQSNLIVIAACMLVMLLCGFHLFAPETFKKEFHLGLSTSQGLFLHMTSVALMIVGIYIILLRSVRLLNSLKISKLKFNDAEIEMDKGISKSILNNHLDEILYFFEVTPYTVVIIEDLDRFQQTEIFTKLRELNLLINNSKKIKREIVFIYAVRDDMFRDKDRTKFFDFIVPVIPVINSSNSNDMLRDVIKKNKYPISESLVDDISYFIDDMRLLYNIVNEYYIYHERLDKKLPQDKLLAMIVYKNIHPNDFVKLSEDKGELFKVIKSKGVYIKSVQDSLDKQIQGVKVEISKLEANKQKDVTELRNLYILQYIANSTNIISFHHNGLSISFQDATSDANFEKFIADAMQYTYLLHQHSNYYYTNNNPLSSKFAQIEKEVDPSQTYSERLALVTDWGNGKIASLREKVVSLEGEKASARHLKLMDLVNAGNVNVSLSNEKQNLLVNILLRNGYIEEDYSEFTSIFYEGSITKEDRQFLLNVKSQIALDFDFGLKKVGKLVEKINVTDFTKHYVLNFSLLDHLLTADRQAESHKRLSLITLLGDESDKSFEFLDAYINHGKYAGKLMKLLYHVWPTLWLYVTASSGFSDERKSIYLGLIIEHADIKDIIYSAKVSHIDREIAEREDFLSLAVPIDKMKTLITKLSIKFKKVNLAGERKELVDFIYQGNYYEINPEILERLLHYYSKYDEGMFSRQNYYALKNSGLTHLTKYIGENLQIYIDNVYLKLPDNISDTEEQVRELLNNEAITAVSREKIIDRMDIKISKLEGIEPDFHTQLMENLKLKPNWDNLLFWYLENEDELHDTGIDFISEESNLSELSKMKININQKEEELTRTKKFITTLLTEDGFDRDVYEQLLKSIPYTYNSLNFGSLKLDKISLLITKGTLSLTSQNFVNLKTSYSPLQIALLTKYRSEFAKRISEFELDDNDLLSLLESTVLQSEEKEIVYLTIPVAQITRKSLFAQSIGELLIQYPNWKIENEQLIEILISKLSMSKTVKLFNMNFKRFSKEEVTALLKAWPSPYSEIAIPGKRPLLEHNEENGYFANNLKTLKYISKAETERRGIRISTFRK